METNNQLEVKGEVHETQLVVNSFATPESFNHIQRVAKMFSESDMVPKRYTKNIGNCVIALEMANRMNANILMVMQNLDVIQGKPGWSSVFLIATLNSCGKFSSLRYEEDEKNGGRTRAWAIDKFSNQPVYGIWVSMEMAKAEGWSDKNGSKWKTMPELMRRYRAASFFTKQFAPEVSMGLQTIEEIYDITPIQERPSANEVANDKERQRIIDHIAKSKNEKQLNEVAAACTNDTELTDLLNNKYIELEGKLL